MTDVTKIPGLQKLWQKTQGDSQICVAVLDGLVDRVHPCFDGANLTQLPTLVQGEANPEGMMSKHGTHVTSVIFGQHGSSVWGIAPQCRGLIIPVFADEGRRLSQLDLSRAIEEAVLNGAHIINISGGQLTDYGEAEDLLSKAVDLCEKSNVLIIAAAGNDGCKCLHVPAALPMVLAVGAIDNLGKPMEFSNWGEAYQTQGILAPGEDILGAKPGGGVTKSSGTSFASPIVSGVAALLLSLQIQHGEKPNPHKVRDAILNSALPCDKSETDANYRCLAGKLNVLGATYLLQGEKMSQQLEAIEAAACGCGGTSNVDVAEEIPETLPLQSETVNMEAITPQYSSSTNSANFVMPSTNLASTNSPYITPSQSNDNGTSLVYALGTLGYDFGTEARRDSFKQLMPGVTVNIPGTDPQAPPTSTVVPAHPYDARQMVDYLRQSPSEAKSLIWTLNLELTPIYAIEPVGPFASNVYAALQELLAGQVLPEDNDDYIERVSIPGRLTGKTVKLFSGQVVPVIQPENERGINGWKVNSIINAALEASPITDEEQRQKVIDTVESFLNRIYYEYRNLGTTSQDRALNFAATNIIQKVQSASRAVERGMELDSIEVEKSPFCRLDSDCWDVKIKFFDPENKNRARQVFRYTVDVSDIFPVTLGEPKQWSAPN